MDAKWISFYLFALAGVIHLGFFVFESFFLQTQKGEKFLKLSPDTYRQVRVWAFNQGFYNLAFALGTFWGLYYVLKLQVMVAGVLTSFCGFSMIMFGMVLWWTVPSMRKLAYLQMGPPLLGFLFLFFHIKGSI
jgi:putative membrane protein